MIDASDVILEVLDARDPLGCRSLAVERLIMERGDKKIVFLLNKIGTSVGGDGWGSG